jgi:hypothetical protein
VRDHLQGNRFVLRTDVQSFYASIDHLMLLDQLAIHIIHRQDRTRLRLSWLPLQSGRAGRSRADDRKLHR